MKQGIQTLLSEAGEAACYALDIIEIAERVTGKNVEPVDALQEGIARGFIHYNETDPADNDNFYVSDPGAFLSMMTSTRWNVRKEGPEYTGASGEYVVDRWERVKTGGIIAHFRLPDWDSLADSQTVRYGKIASKRVFKRIA
jgi:hypothetical protein